MISLLTLMIIASKLSHTKEDFFNKVKLFIWFLQFHDCYLFSSYSLKIMFLVPIVYILILLQSLQFKVFFLVLIICILILFQSLQFESDIFSPYNLYFNYLLVLITKKYIKIISYKLIINYQLFFYYKLSYNKLVMNYLLIFLQLIVIDNITHILMVRTKLKYKV